MEQRINELKPYLRRLQYAHQLSPEHKELINRGVEVVLLYPKERNDEPSRR